MIRFKLGEVMEKKRFEDGKRFSITEIAAATGLSRVTLSKILNQKGYGTGTDTIDRLCQFFGCKVDDLMEHLPDVVEEANAGNSHT
jgi:DNA-binding Xre family transcriptional regulator